MKRNPTETFAAYKVRRAVANKATKAINAATRKGGTVSARAQLRQTMKRFTTGIKGMASSRNTAYGASLRNHFDATMGMRRV